MSSNESDDSSEDEILEQAALNWAAASASNKTTTREGDDDKQSTPTTTQQQQQQPLSLHVTQLSFQATDHDVRSHFVDNGCVVTSVRLVYDRSGTTKTFRGVAFVDVADRESYEKALQLNRSVLLKRKINVRPTKTKSELSSIVERTKELVQIKIQQRREHQEAKDTTSGDNNKKKRKSIDKSSDKKKHGNKTRTHKMSDATRKHKRPKIHADGTTERKLTKKERNRRAAIIMSKKKRSNK